MNTYIQPTVNLGSEYRARVAAEKAAQKAQIADKSALIDRIRALRAEEGLSLADAKAKAQSEAAGI
jgi:hypothetical protein